MILSGFKWRFSWLPRVKIRKECCWLLSNICAGPVHQVLQLRDAGFLPRFVAAARDDEFCVRKEAAFAIANASERQEVLPELMDAGCMEVMRELLDSHDGKMQHLGLCFGLNAAKGLRELKDVGDYARQFYEAFGHEDVERLCDDGASESVREKARELIEMLEESDGGL